MDISKQLCQLARALKVTFMLSQRVVMPEEIFQDTGLFPAIVRRADQLASLCLGYGLGASFTEAEGALLGVRVAFDDVTPNALRYLCILDVLYELIHASGNPSAVSLDELMYD
ncbi:MAG: type IV secretion protein IcmS [Gammaproteobacteria bacterium]|nr:type IV secretion protein IcmS [Gammaproteobacteria bacterium]